MVITDMEEEAERNLDFRRVIYTGAHCQLVVMSIDVGEEIGEEVHTDTDQILFFVDGRGKAVLDGEERIVVDDDVVFVPAGTTHNFINVGDKPLKLYTVYAPAEHPDGTVHHTKADAEKAGH